MNNIVFIKNNQIVTDSIKIAKEFGKDHFNVKRDIKSAIKNIGKLKKSKEATDLEIDFSSLKFEECDYQSENGQTYTKFDLNFDAFMLVTMGYTTSKAMLIKMKYINEFNRMKNELAKKNTPSYMIDDPITRAERWIAEQKEVQKLKIENREQKPIVDYYHRIMQSRSTVTTTQIAQDYGLSAQALNKILHDAGIQYKVGGQWILYSKFKDKGYVDSYTLPIVHKDGHESVQMNTKWTQKGRKLIHETLDKRNIHPQVYRTNEVAQ